MTVKYVLGVACVHLAQTSNSGLFQAVQPAEILFFFTSFSCQCRDDSEANFEAFSQKFLISIICQLLAITLVAPKGMLALKIVKGHFPKQLWILG